MMDSVANHAMHPKASIGRAEETVERFIDACLSIEHLIDPHSVFIDREAGGADEPYSPSKLPAKDYMDSFINPAR